MSAPATTSTFASRVFVRRSPAHRLLVLARITRVDRALVAALYVFLGGYLSGARVLAEPVFRSALVILLMVCFANAINDYEDVEVDTVAKPHRPIPSGDFSRNAAGWLATMLAVIAVAIAYTLGPVIFVLAILTVALSAAYSWWLKGTLLLGNAVVATLVGSTVLYGAIASNLLSTTVIAAGALIALYVLGQEVLFNLEDEEGDRAGGVGTTATRLRASGTLVLYRVLAIAIMLIALIPAVLRAAPLAYLLAILACVVIPILALLFILRGPMSAVKVARAARLSRLVWFTGVVPLLLLRP